MTILFASDLDRTLIYSKNSRGTEVQEQDLSAVEWVEEKPTAFMTKKEVEYFQKLSPAITFCTCHYKDCRSIQSNYRNVWYSRKANLCYCFKWCCYFRKWETPYGMVRQSETTTPT